MDRLTLPHRLGDDTLNHKKRTGTRPLVVIDHTIEGVSWIVRLEEVLSYCTERVIT